MTLKVMCVDDNTMHLSLIQQQLKAAARQMGNEVEVLGTANNGLDGFNLYEKLLAAGTKPDFCTFDIRMPNMDGLSALLKIKRKYPTQKVIMVSSEDESTVARKGGKAADLPLPEKMNLLKKVEDRILSGNQEQGKINRILDACEELLLDPIEIAQQYKANGYLQKPYQLDSTQKVLAGLAAGSSTFIRAK